MPTKKTEPAAPQYPQPGLTGPADTDDPTTRVTSTTPNPTADDLRTGRTRGAVALEPREVPPLQLASDPRIEHYEVVAPGNVVVEVTHNLDTGESTYHWTDRVEPGVYFPASPNAAPEG